MQLVDGTATEPDVLITLRRAQRNGSAKLVLGAADELELLAISHFSARQMVVLLFKRSDPNAPPQMYSHRATKNIRKADKQREEDVAYSAHLFINTDNVGTEDQPKYSSLLEEVPGVAKSQVLSLLKKLLADAKYTYKNHHNEDKETYTAIDFRGVPTATLSESLAGSRIPRITLVRQAVTDGLDTGGMAVAREQRMPINLKATPNPIPLIRQIKEWGREQGWTDFRVDIDMPEKRSRTVSMTREDDAAEAMFIRSIPVELINPIDVCSHQIVAELVDHAYSIFRVKPCPH